MTEPPEEADAYVSYIREKLGKRFAPTGGGGNVNCDIEQNVREIRALLKINAEIFGRCMDSASNYYDGKSALFRRYGFDAVKIRQYQTNTTQFITEYERSQQTFDMKPLSALPASLNDLFALKYQAYPFDVFIDYDTFFQFAIMLHDDILGDVLAELRSHIESIHVCLGGVETWLLEPNSNIEFLEATFGVQLDIPTADDFDKECICIDGTHVISDLCLHCHRSYESHVCQRFGGVGMYKHRCYSGGREAFKCTKIHILKSFCESGKFEKTFSIANQGDQIKLKKFLEFMES